MCRPVPSGALGILAAGPNGRPGPLRTLREIERIKLTQDQYGAVTLKEKPGVKLSPIGRSGDRETLFSFFNYDLFEMWVRGAQYYESRRKKTMVLLIMCILLANVSDAEAGQRREAGHMATVVKEDNNSTNS